MIKDFSRFVYRPEHLIDGVVGKEAFIPPSTPRPYETSVSRHCGCDIDWVRAANIGLARKRPLAVLGSAEVCESDILIAGLCHDDDGAGPYPKHANIKGWDEVDELMRYAAADILATQASFVETPTQIQSNSGHEY